jgi:hypothetical protein
MSPTMSDRLADVHPQMLRAKGEGDRKKLADLRPAVGQLVARAFQLMGITKQDAAYQMHYDDPGTVSRWCSGTERPAFDKLFTLDGFNTAYVQAIAEQDPQLEITTAITIRRRAV